MSIEDVMKILKESGLVGNQDSKYISSQNWESGTTKGFKRVIDVSQTTLKGSEKINVELLCEDGKTRIWTRPNSNSTYILLQQLKAVEDKPFQILKEGFGMQTKYKVVVF